ncbi:putative metacaspase [Rhizodiscina lignyota]|uniref:Metacaspase n=1 Tax=Rhizodiscina lignyota TaxID=1504668 RepID=A0A9P4I8W2_9PEZI|nr:putative metacaspase [Rhizodiscina lignyota]
MGRRKALLIGINYTGSQHELKGCRQDVRNMVPFLKSRGFVADESSMVILADDLRGPHFPTGHNILAAMDWLVSEPNCSLFLHYSGHGGQVPDQVGDRASGFSDTIVPVDYQWCGQIDSGTLHRHLVSALAPGCQLHVVFDCCHSGSAIELPYVYRSDSDGNVRMLDNVRQGMRLASAASHLLQGDFSIQQSQDARQLYAGAKTFFKSLQHIGESHEEGLGEEYFCENWKGENKRVIMFSGCRDDQTSADANIAGGHVGAMSWAFLETVRAYGNLSYLQLLQNTRWLLRQRYTQVPQLSVGSEMDLNQPLFL